VFGTPGADAWAWRFGGHHLSLHHTIAGGEVLASTPCFFGADPAAAPLLGPHLHRPLAGVEDLARELVHDLSDQQRSLAVVSPVAPVDLVGGNRSQLVDGDTTLQLPLIWRGRLDDELDAAMAASHQAAEERAGVTAATQEAVAFTTTPKGIAAGQLEPGQRDGLRALLDLYLHRLPDEVAGDEAAKYAGSGIEQLSFLWAGGLEAGQPHYYRVQGAGLLVEYDNVQRNVNHIHSVWRDLRSDFGRDALAEHYTRDH
jgi:hypothetical protein